MVSPNQFRSMGASIFPEQEREIILAKQPVLADYGREVRSAISNLPPEISREFLAEYKEPTAHLVGKMEEAILSRELAIENASQESSLDRQWLEGAQKKMDEIGLSSDDEWNMTP